MDRAPLLTLMAIVLVGCGSEQSEPPGPAPDEECLPPNRLVDERCLEPGVQDNGCPAGTLGLSDGSCQPAGVPPGGCAEGFVHDGDAGCEPILPAEPCPVGLMAVPGETDCHPVMDCGDGPWGNIPVDATTVYVDAAYGGGSSDGSDSQPFTTIGEAVAAAADGALIAVAAGTYAEDVVLQKRVRLWGVCPERAVVAGTGASTGALDLRPGADGTEVQGLAVTGDNPAAVAVSGAQDVIFAHLWVHDARRGFTVEGVLGPTSVTLRRSLVEHNRAQGIVVSGSEATLEGLVVRDTLPQHGDQLFGYGIVVQRTVDVAAATSVVVRGSLVERNHTSGVLVISAVATLEGLVVRGTLPQQSDQRGGRGISIQCNLATGAPASAVVSGSLVEQNHEVGVLVGCSEATLEGLVVRDTLPQQSDQELGRGINIQMDTATGAPASAIVRGSLVEHNHEIGVYVSGSEATLEGLLVRDTLPQQSDQLLGRGINIQNASAYSSPTSAVIRGSLVEHNHDLGVSIACLEATLEGLIVRGTLPRQSDQLYGRGINIQNDPDSDIPTSAAVRGSLIEQSYDLGVCIIDAQSVLEGLVVRDTLARAPDGLFGDGVVIVREVGSNGTVVAASRVTDNGRAGLSNFGGQVTLGGSALSCNAIDLAGEIYRDQPFVFEDLGDNSCGCPEATGACKAISTGLNPPEPVDETP